MSFDRQSTSFNWLKPITYIKGHHMERILCINANSSGSKAYTPAVILRVQNCHFLSTQDFVFAKGKLDCMDRQTAKTQASLAQGFAICIWLKDLFYGSQLL